MERRLRQVLAGGATVCLFLTVQLGALALVDPFLRANLQPVEDPSDPVNGLLYFLGVLVASGLMLLAVRRGVERLLRPLVLLTAGLIAWFVLLVLAPPVVVAGWDVLALGGALALVAALYRHPEWYVVDLAGVVMGAGAGGLFGITFGILPAVVLLTALAVYDAVSVYRTEHMLDLAEGAIDLRIPVFFVVPTTLPYSLSARGSPADDGRSSTPGGAGGDPRSAGARSDGARAGRVDDGPADRSGGRDDRPERAVEADDATDVADADPSRDALFVGLGDAVMPTVVVASAATFVSAPSLGVPGLALTLPALGAIAGTVAGLVALLALVFRGRAHAGLPLLNGGAIAGYLLGAAASGIGPVAALGLAPYL